MDLPLFHLDFFGNRLLIAVIAILHVFINHPMAVGAIPLITFMEWRGKRTGDANWDRLAYRLLTVCFIITTSIGAMTGVGIWFSTSLVNPYAIGSLIRVFYWAWFLEWIVFVTEVVLILIYYFTWKRMEGAKKNLHIAIGAVLSLTSWLTMAVIVAILGYMMDVGNWTEEKGIATAVLNPIYLPQLAFRTPLAMVSAGFFCLFLTFFFTQKGGRLQASAARFISAWSLIWLPLCLAGGLWYWKAIPSSMADHLDVALATQAFANRYDAILYVLSSACVIAFVTLIWAVMKPARLPRYALLAPFLVAGITLGYFERVREFIRKPYVIGDYMYANGIRVKDYPLLQQQGVLTYSAYSSVKIITEENQVAAGSEVFRIACTRCHTTNGVNGILARFSNLYGSGPWDAEMLKLYIQQMHNARPFMPPFPGSEAELDALAEYIVSLKNYPTPIQGAQTAEHSRRGDDSENL